jgi:hypothetical protein
MKSPPQSALEVLVFLISASSTLNFNVGGLGFSGLTPPKHGPSLISSFLVSQCLSMRLPPWFNWAKGSGRISGMTGGSMA